MVGNLIVGGHDTTASQIACSLLALLRHPEALGRPSCRPVARRGGRQRDDPIRAEHLGRAAHARRTGRDRRGRTSRRLARVPLVGVDESTSRRVGRSRCVPARTVHRARCAQAAVVRVRRALLPRSGTRSNDARGSGARCRRRGARRPIVSSRPLDVVEWRSVLGRSPASLPVVVDPERYSWGLTPGVTLTRVGGDGPRGRQLRVGRRSE